MQLTVVAPWIIRVVTAEGTVYFMKLPPDHVADPAGIFTVTVALVLDWDGSAARKSDRPGVAAVQVAVVQD